MKEKEAQRKYEAKIQAKAETLVSGDVESLWMKLKESLLAAADEVCGRTKDPPIHRVSWWWNEDVAKAVEEIV